MQRINLFQEVGPLGSTFFVGNILKNLSKLFQLQAYNLGLKCRHAIL